MALHASPHTPHVWYSPADCAALLEATKHGDHWRASCPAHHGDNPLSLRISEGRDSHGNPATLLHCFAHECSIEEICAAMGIHLRNLFCIHPTYAKATKNAPRARSSRIERLRQRQTCEPNDIAQMLLEEMIVSDPTFIEECAPARVKMWELASTSSAAREGFNRALREIRLTPARFWEELAREAEGWARP